MRLDTYLHNNSFVDSRNKAQTLIKDGSVQVDGAVIKKPSFKVEENSEIEILKEKIYVSRSAEKLKLFLEDSSLNAKGLDALDIGASTGGFTEILLENGISSVTALDVGTLQLSEKLRNDERVTSVENMDIRDFQSQPFSLIVCDVSFISLHSILEPIDRLSKNDIILLFKPQFEVGRGSKRNRNGVVVDISAIEEAKERFLKASESFGWKIVEIRESKKRGKEGNIEFFYHFRKSN